MATENIIMAMVKAGGDRQVWGVCPVLGLLVLPLAFSHTHLAGGTERLGPTVTFAWPPCVCAFARLRVCMRARISIC